MINHVASNIGQIKKMTSQLKFKSNRVDFNTVKNVLLDVSIDFTYLFQECTKMNSWSLIFNIIFLTAISNW